MKVDRIVGMATSTLAQVLARRYQVYDNSYDVRVPVLDGETPEAVADKLVAMLSSRGTHFESTRMSKASPVVELDFRKGASPKRDRSWTLTRVFLCSAHEGPCSRRRPVCAGVCVECLDAHNHDPLRYVPQSLVRFTGDSRSPAHGADELEVRVARGLKLTHARRSDFGAPSLRRIGETCHGKVLALFRPVGDGPNGY